jgi:RNA polymerase sigma-70 factor (ECF subfamily)
MAKGKDEFLKVIEAHKGIIYKISRAYCENDEDRKDLIQEIIIQIWRSFQKYDDRYKHSTWIYRIALNVAISLYRKNLVRKERIVALSPTVNLIDNDQLDEKEEDLVLLYRFIHELGNLNKALILLYLEEKNYQEIAEILNITETNVATKLGRIKKGIKQKFLDVKK